MKKLAGACLIASPFVAIFIYYSSTMGAAKTAGAFLLVGAIVVILWAGVELMFSE